MPDEILKKIFTVKDTLNNLSVERLKNEEFFKDCKEEFAEVTDILSKFLPIVEDPILFEIDDILYPGQDYKGNENDKYASESNKLCYITNISRYFTAHRYMLDEEDIFLDNTVLKLLQFTSIIQCDLAEACNTIMTLLHSNNARKLCIGLKMLKIFFEKKSSECYKNKRIYSMLSRWMDITEANEPNKKKMSIFISNLAGECRNLMGDKYVFPEIELSEKKIIVEGIHSSLFAEAFPDYYVDFFYNTFVKLEKETDKHKYLEYILRGINSFYYGSYLQSGFSTIIDNLLYNISSCKSQSANKEMILIDVEHGRGFKYLDNIDVAIDSEKVWSDKVWSDEVDVKDAEETDYTFEKFFLYDEVKKNLHLLVIFYSACAECFKLCEDEFVEEDYTDIFRGQNFLMDYIAFFLQHPDLVVPWHIEKTMQMCPFLLFPLEHKDLVIDLIKYLRREEVPNMSKELSSKIEEMESLYSLVNLYRELDLSSYEKR